MSIAVNVLTGQVTDVPDPAPIPPVAADVIRERMRREQTGAAFPVTGLATSPVNLTGEMRANLRDFAQLAMVLAGDFGTRNFEDDAGTVHSMTGAQVIELYALGAAYVEGLITASRALRAMDPIPADFTDNSYWSA